MSHINAIDLGVPSHPCYLVCSCKRGDRDPADDVRHPIEGTDRWQMFDLYSDAKDELDRLLSQDDTYCAALSMVLDDDGSYFNPPRPVKFTDRFWRILKHQMTT